MITAGTRNGDHGWPAIIGYGYELLHTSALEALLNDDHVGPQLAEQLISGPLPFPQRVDSVGNTRREPRTVGRLRADLRFTVNQTADVIVETKVDTVPRLEQLTAMIPPESGHRGIALVVGYGDLLCPAQRLATAPGWSIVTLEDWHQILNVLDGRVSPDLAAYRTAVTAEYCQRKRLMDAAQHGGWPQPGAPTPWRHGEWALNVAWLAQARGALGQSDGGWITEGWTAATVNGIQIGREIPGWRVDHSDGHTNVYVEILANHEARWLAIKTGGTTASHRNLIDTRLLADLASTEGWAPGRRPRADSRTSTIARLNLGPHDPADAATVVLDAIQRLNEGVRHALVPN